ncbi:MAG: hypothetical protein QW304_08690 [Thermoproteota archaeon]
MGLEAPGVQEVFRVKYSVSLFLVDEAAVMVKGLMAWVWVAYEPFSKRTISFRLSWIRNGIQVGLFLESLVMAFGRHPVWTDEAPWYHRYRFGDWLFQAMERAVQMLKDRAESFDDHFPCRSKS